MKFGLLILALCFFVACEKKEPEKPKVTILKAQLQELQAELASFDLKLKQASDPGARAALGEQKELLKSRIERVKEILRVEAPEALPAEGAAAASHH